MNTKMCFKQFFRKYNLDGIKSVVYAYRDYSVTIKGISDELNITESAVRNCIKYAIINCICSYQTALQIKQIAHDKQFAYIKNPSERTPSDRYYEQILRQRLEFVNNIRDSEMLEVITYFLASQNLPMDDITDTIGYSEKELKTICVNAIKHKMVDPETATKLQSTSLMQS